MALIEKYHVVAASKEVLAGQTINEGQVVSLDANANVVIQSATNPIPYGIAGDTKSTSASSMPGIESGYQNRVSDYFDETSASGMMTVYHSGGEFATDQFSANVSAAAIMDPLYANAGNLCSAEESTTSGIVARLTLAAGTYPSSVPGIDLNGDQALSGDNNNTYLEVKLVI